MTRLRPISLPGMKRFSAGITFGYSGPLASEKPCQKDPQVVEVP
jgi:hypothetical protein